MFFFYFTHLFLQNTHINLSILHIYSIKYSKPNNHQPDQYSATINDQYLALHHQPTTTIIKPASIINPPIKILATINPINTHSSKPIEQNHQIH